MKLLCLVTLLFSYSIVFSQTKKNSQIVGNPIIFEKLMVAEHIFSNPMNWDDAKEACAKLGQGWRLPTIDELKIMFQNKDKIFFL